MGLPLYHELDPRDVKENDIYPCKECGRVRHIDDILDDKFDHICEDCYEPDEEE